MKIRNGFVSNSSSSSFIMIGVDSRLTEKQTPLFHGIKSLFISEYGDVEQVTGYILEDTDEYLTDGNLSFTEIIDKVEELTKKLNVEVKDIKLYYGTRPAQIMIDKHYINEAKRIREEYLKNLIYIAKEEDNIKSLTEDLEKIGKEIEDSESKSEKYYKDVLFEIEIMIRKATEKILPYHEKKKELDKKQRSLYNTIKDKYPDITDEQIKNDIIPHIIEIDNKYKEKYNNLLK